MQYLETSGDMSTEGLIALVKALCGRKCKDPLGKPVDCECYTLGFVPEVVSWYVESVGRRPSVLPSMAA